MGGDKKIALDMPGKNLERETQAQFYENPELNEWAIFSMEGKDKVMNDFMSNFQTFVKQMKINCKPPKTFKLS